MMVGLLFCVASSSSAFRCGHRLKAVMPWSRPTGSSAPRVNCTRQTSARRLGHLTIREFLIWRSVIGRDGDEAGITDHIDQNFHPHGHDAPFPADKLRKGRVSSCIIRRSDPRDRMARDRTRLAVRDNENPAHIRRCRRGLSCFTSRKVAALKIKTSRHGLRSCRYRNSLLRFHATYFVGDNGEGRASFCRFRLNARTRAGPIRSAHWPGSSRNTPRARVRTSAGFP